MKYKSENGVNRPKETNRIRRINDMPELVNEKRNCLRCDKEFVTYQKNIRLCDRCKNPNYIGYRD